MFNCYAHNWSSRESVCPICFPLIFESSTQAVILSKATDLDKLDEMMRKQELLNSNVINKMGLTHYDGASEVVRREWIDKFASALQDEVCETRKATSNYSKWWKDSTKPMDAVKEEIVDQLHFIMAEALAAGMDAHEMFERYDKKNEENFKRKDWNVNK